MHTICGEERPAYDVIVVGSGAGGLASAVVASRHGASVLVLEKASCLGGTSAVSGGMVWVPGSRQARALTETDDTAKALEYVQAVARGRGRYELFSHAVQHSSKALSYLEDECGLSFELLDDFPDYREDLPGSANGGRTLEPRLYDSTDISALVGFIRDDGRAPFTMQEYERWGAFTKFPWDELDERAERGMLARGRALIGSLLASATRSNVTVAVETEVERIRTTDGRATGVEVRGGRVFTAEKAVVIATGGFEWDRRLADSMVQSRIHTMCSPPTNTGDGLRMAQRLGASIRGTREAWWAPMAIVGDVRDGQPIGTLLRFERQGPGSIMVNKQGRRFVNESQNYNDLARALHSWDPTANAPLNTPAYVIIDSRYLKLYGLFSHRHGSPTPDYLVEGSDIAELARKLGVSEQNLESTVERFNRHAAAGIDPTFHRGESAYDRYWGDDDNPWPNPSLAPLEEAPFYALEVVNGVFGTNGGIGTNGEGAVLDVDGIAIPGLFAVGNVAESAYGAGYPGAGATLGPILTYAYNIGRATSKLPS